MAGVRWRRLGNASFLFTRSREGPTSQVEIWDGATGLPAMDTLEARLPPKPRAAGAAADGDDAAAGPPLSVPRQGFCMALALFEAAPGQLRLLAGWEDGRVGLWDPRQRALLAVVQAHREPGTAPPPLWRKQAARQQESGAKSHAW